MCIYIYIYVCICSDTLFADLINSELLCNFQVIQSLQTAEGMQLVPAPRSTIHTAADLAEQLKTLGFRLEAQGSWQQIGLLPLEGPPPDLQALDRRMGISRLVLSISETRGWARSHRAGFDDMRTTLENAHRACVHPLPAILASRKQAQTFTLDAWRELEQATITWLHTSAPTATEVIATQLSNILPCSQTSHPRVFPRHKARQIIQALYQGDVSAL